MCECLCVLSLARQCIKAGMWVSGVSKSSWSSWLQSLFVCFCFSLSSCHHCHHLLLLSIHLCNGPLFSLICLLMAFLFMKFLPSHLWLWLLLPPLSFPFPLLLLLTYFILIYSSSLLNPSLTLLLLYLQITTDLRHRCTDSHTGTSASAPMAAAIIALALEAK